MERGRLGGWERVLLFDDFVGCEFGGLGEDADVEAGRELGEVDGGGGANGLLMPEFAGEVVNADGGGSVGVVLDLEMILYGIGR